MDDLEQQKALFRRLFDEYSGSIFRYAKYSLPADIDSRDVVQEVFLRAFRSWNEFRGQSSEKTWLFRIARNYIYDLLRKKRRERAHELIDHATDRPVYLDTTIELEDALSRVSPIHQQILNLRWIQDMTVSEVAEVLGWSESKVRVTFYRAKKQLREILQEPSNGVWQTSSEGGESVEGKQS